MHIRPTTRHPITVLLQLRERGIAGRRQVHLHTVEQLREIVVRDPEVADDLAQAHHDRVGGLARKHASSSARQDFNRSIGVPASADAPAAGPVERASSTRSSVTRQKA